MLNRHCPLEIMHTRLFSLLRCVDDWRVYCSYWSRAKKTIRKERRKCFIIVFAGMDTSTMWRILRKLGYLEGNDSRLRFDVDEVNDYLDRIATLRLILTNMN